jgi:trehalose 6-phosphate phosphatase
VRCTRVSTRGVARRRGHAEGVVLDEIPKIRSDWALFLDIDGTLLDIAQTPDGVVVPSDLRASLGALHAQLGGALALVSGRPISTIDRLFAPLVLPAAGQHGAELRDERGMDHRAPPPPRLAAVVSAFAEFASSRPGLAVEDKGNSVTLHYRAAPHYRDEAHALARLLIGVRSGELEMLPSRMAVEIKPRAVDKGSALAWFLAHPPFHGRIPVCVGDDLTDEDGFAAVNRRGGHSIRVGRDGEGDGDGGARFRLPSPAEVRAWLAACVEELAHEEAVRE